MLITEQDFLDHGYVKIVPEPKYMDFVLPNIVCYGKNNYFVIYHEKSSVVELILKDLSLGPACIANTQKFYVFFECPTIVFLNLMINLLDYGK